MQLSKIISTIVAAPNVSYIVSGAPGSGKTQGIAQGLREAGYEVIRLDCIQLPAEDLAQVPVVKKDGTLSFAFPVKFKARPKVAFILDELFKAPNDVINAFIPLVHGRDIYGQTFPLDTPVIITANSSEYKVGDSFKPHIGNRCVQLEVDNISAADAQRVMLDLNFDSRIISWSQKVPQALVSYDASLADKPETETEFYFGFSGRRPRQPFCSMRSLELASHLLKGGVTDSESLQGAIGKNAATSLALYCREIQHRVDPADILNGTAIVPEHLFDARVATMTACSMLDETNWLEVITYIARLPKELQGVASRLLSAKKVTSVLMKHARFVKFVSKLMT